jgi:hypothetical protein
MESWDLQKADDYNFAVFRDCISDVIVSFLDPPSSESKSQSSARKQKSRNGRAGLETLDDFSSADDLSEFADVSCPLPAGCRVLRPWKVHCFRNLRKPASGTENH